MSRGSSAENCAAGSSAASRGSSVGNSAENCAAGSSAASRGSSAESSASANCGSSDRSARRARRMWIDYFDCSYQTISFLLLYSHSMCIEGRNIPDIEWQKYIWHFL